MNANACRWTTAMLIIAAFGCARQAPPTTAPPGSSPVADLRIFVPLDEAPDGVPADPQVDRLGLARLNRVAWEEFLARKSGAAYRGRQLSLDLFGRGIAPLTLIVSDVIGGDGGRSVVTAHTPEGPGQAVLTYDKVRLDVILRSPQGDVIIRQWRDDVYLVTQMKRLTQLACATRGREGPLEASLSSAGKSMELKKGQVPAIDVLVLYTPAVVKNWPCGLPCDEATRRSQVESHLVNGFHALNMDLTCSQVHMQLVPTAVTLYDYAERGTIEEDVAALTGSGWSRLAPLRKAAGADLVTLIAWARNLHGMATRYDHIVSMQNDDALSVVDSTAAIPLFSLAHELAHNMGAGHYPYDRTGAYAYSQGWFYEQGQKQEQVTIMGEINVTGRYRFNRFSNPHVRYEGNPTGFPDVADNALTLNQNRDVVAAFVKGGKGVTPIACSER